VEELDVRGLVTPASPRVGGQALVLAAVVVALGVAVAPAVSLSSIS
jgi:hypothetical protein